MFYPVRIRDASGKIKKVVSSRQLSRDYWRQFDSVLSGEMGGRKKQSRPNRQPDEEEREPEDIKG